MPKSSQSTRTLTKTRMPAVPTMSVMKTLNIIDSHTGGEPTRLVVSGGPELGGGTLAQRLDTFRTRFDEWRAGIVTEPRGSDVVVGALLCEPDDPTCAAGVIFFNNVGYLGMCGHGTIGLIVSLAHLGRLAPGRHRIETPVGAVEATLNANGSVSVRNVPAWRHVHAVTVDVPGHGPLTGDVAWGGNWFFLTAWDRPIALPHVDALTDAAWRIRGALTTAGVTGAGGAEIDHVELFGPPTAPGAHAKSFVLCPGRAYDRSPCGTGTCAKLACLADDGALAPGAVWVQESVVGTTFEASYRRAGGEILPRITGRAYVTGELTLIFDPADPFSDGIRPVTA
jgi:4-hydroxyproline epimerase